MQGETRSLDHGALAGLSLHPVTSMRMGFIEGVMSLFLLSLGILNLKP